VDAKLAAAVEVAKSDLSSFGHHPYQAVNSTVATDTLASKLGIEKAEARQLCLDAVEHLGGHVTPGVPSRALRRGVLRRPGRETWWVDRAKL
jgi:hypothetical protein